MFDFFITYAGGNIICLIIFGILLSHDLLSVDRQEKQRKFDNTLIAVMLYFVSDSIWAAVVSGIIPATMTSVVITNLANYFIMAYISYTWLGYVMALVNMPNRNSRKTQWLILSPFAVSTVIMILVFVFNRQVMISDALKIQPAVYLFLVLVPDIYTGIVMFVSIRRALREKNLIEKRKHLYVGFFPLLTIAGGMVQLNFAEDKPLFCFSCTILMLVFFINMMEDRISIDPLTGLNNRGQLIYYSMQKNNVHREGRETFVIMMDANGFKMINDNYGHAEGDSALVIIANALKKTVKNVSMPLFLARYGGDEFIIIAHPVNEEEIKKLVRDIRCEIESQCINQGKPYIISIGAGYDKLQRDEAMENCIQRADRKMYLDKKR